MSKAAPSVLSADFINLGEEILSVESADLLHFDVMDGVFVPNISFGIPILESVRKFTEMTLDVHLMIDRPVRYAERFCRAGADIVTVHAEADSAEEILRALEIIRQNGKKTGLSLKPATPPEAITRFAGLFDMVLVMTVEPGFGGQSFMYDMLPKIKRVREIAASMGIDCAIGADGGVTLETGKLCADAGADILVAGSAVFNAPDRALYIKKLQML